MYMSSQCTNDGTYTLTVTFKLGIDLNIAQVLVQNRVSLAQPILPDLVQAPRRDGQEEVAQRADDRQPLLAGRQPQQPLPEQLRHHPAHATSWPACTGVGDITYLGQRDYSMRALARPAEAGGAQPDRRTTWSTPSRSRTSRWRPGRSASRRCPAGQVFQYTMTTLGRLADAEQFGDMILKTDAAGPARPPQRRGPHRAGRPELRPDLHARRQALGGPVGLPAARLQRPGDGRARSRTKMEELKKRFPARPRLRHRLRHDAVHQRVDQRGLQDAARRGHPGGHRRAAVPAELAVGAHPADRRAGGHRRHLRRHGRASASA